MKLLKTIIITLLLAGIYTAARGQGAPDVLRYSLQYPENDAITLVMSGVSNITGFGAYQQNPAVMAFSDHSYFSIGLSDRYTNEKGTYIGNSQTGDDNRANIGNAGFVYNVPTQRGRLTIGAGYSQSHDFNRTLSVRARNDATTITDTYNTTSDIDLGDAAFNVFAIDSVGNGTKSIFRADGPYQGITQHSQSTKRGVLGEYSAFVASEFAKNLILGASIGVISGTYSYERDFLESDTQNDYETQFLDQNNNLTGIDNILSTDTIDETVTAFSLRLGAVYQITPHVNIGASYQFKNVLHIDEDYNTVITNTLDDGTTYDAEAPASVKYKVVRPARFNIGVTAKDVSGFTISASGEHVAYSQGRIRFNAPQDQGAEDDINHSVKSNLDDVVNLRFGLQYKVKDEFIPRVGYSYYASPTKSLNYDRNFYSAGFSSRITPTTIFNVGAQLGRWNDSRTLYSTTQGDEVAYEDINHWHFMAGLKFLF